MVIEPAQLDPVWGYHVRGQRSGRDAIPITVSELAFADDISGQHVRYAARMLNAIAAGR